MEIENHGINFISRVPIRTTKIVAGAAQGSKQPGMIASNLVFKTVDVLPQLTNV